MTLSHQMFFKLQVCIAKYGKTSGERWLMKNRVLNEMIKIDIQFV